QPRLRGHHRRTEKEGKGADPLTELKVPVATGEPVDPLRLKERLKRALAARRRVPMASGPVPAAVLIPLYLKDGEFHLFFTKRTSQLTHHSGEISFPGGVREPEDRDCAATALREAWEEVGIVPADVEVLGELDDCHSIHNYLVT